MKTLTFEPLIIFGDELNPAEIRAVVTRHKEWVETMRKPGEIFDGTVKDYDENEYEILDYLNSSGQLHQIEDDGGAIEQAASAYSPTSVNELKVLLYCEYCYVKCYEWLKDHQVYSLADDDDELKIVPVNRIDQKSLNNLFNLELFTVGEVNDLISKICHLCRHDDAAKDEIMYLIGEKYPQFNEDRIHETTEILFDFIEGHLEYEEDE
jgi:hypothetical protein